MKKKDTVAIERDLRHVVREPTFIVLHGAPSVSPKEYANMRNALYSLRTHPALRRTFIIFFPNLRTNGFGSTSRNVGLSTTRSSTCTAFSLIFL